jgi:hypothetical protein
MQKIKIGDKVIPPNAFQKSLKFMIVKDFELLNNGKLGVILLNPETNDKSQNYLLEDLELYNHNSK